MGLILRHAKFVGQGGVITAPESIAVAMLADVLENVFPTKIPRPHVVGLSFRTPVALQQGEFASPGHRLSERRFLIRLGYWKNRDFLAPARLGVGGFRIGRSDRRHARSLLFSIPGEGNRKLGPLSIERMRASCKCPENSAIPNPFHVRQGGGALRIPGEWLLSLSTPHNRKPPIPTQGSEKQAHVDRQNSVNLNLSHVAMRSVVWLQNSQHSNY